MPRVAAILVAACSVLPLGAQPAADGPADQTSASASAASPIEISGAVGQIHIVAGRGTPYFELKHSAGVTRVYLGPMPYLIAENFNPKSGQDVIVKGHKSQDGMVASQVTLVAEKRTVRFRDDKGWPVWRGGFGRGR